MVTPTTYGPLHSYTYSNVSYIDALLDASRADKWGSGGAGTGATVSYSFPDENSYWSTGSYGSPSLNGEPWWPDYAPLGTSEQAAFEAALNSWAEVANIHFVEVADNVSTVGDIRIAYSGLVGHEGAAAWAYYPQPDPASGDIWLDPGYNENYTQDPGSYGMHVLVHELGHALGLDHSFSGPFRLPSSTDSDQYTAMSYTDDPYSTLWSAEPQLYDVAAIQYLYGANMTTRTGDDVYSYSNSTEFRDTIWDAGGIDTIDASNQTLGVTINLNEGAFSSIGIRNSGGAVKYNVAVAYNAHIENATGGSGNDVLNGNGLDNALSGNGGNDKLSGAGGNDTLVGGSGNDTMSGGAGDDRLTYDPADPSVLGDTGRDTLVLGGSATVNLANSTDQVTGGGKAQGFESVDGSAANSAVSLTGSKIANMFVGGSANDILSGGSGKDVLIGGPGADQLTGGGGSDTFDYSSLAEKGDVIKDFSATVGGDVLDISRVLTGYHSGDPVSGFVAVKTSGSNAIVQIDVDGGGDAFQDLVTLQGASGLTLNKLLANGNLDLLV